MARNFKALGLALMAVLALSAVGAAGARAQLKMRTTGPTWLTLEEIPKGVLKIGLIEVYCTNRRCSCDSSQRQS